MKKNNLFLSSALLVWFSCGNTEAGQVPPHEKTCRFSNEEIKFIEGVKENIYFTIYLTGDLPDGLKKIEEETKKLLIDFQFHNSKINFSFKNLHQDKNQERVAQKMEELYKQGVPYSELEMIKDGRPELKIIFPGGVVSCRGKEFPVSLFDIPQLGKNFNYKTLHENISGGLNFKFLSLIKKAMAPQKPVVAFLGGHGEANEHQTFSIAQEMKIFYEVKRINIKNNEGKYDLHCLDELDGLIICGPTQPFDNREKFIIDQFLMNGGKIIWLTDPVYVDEKELSESGETIGLAAGNEINNWLFSYGVKLNAEVIVAENCAPIAFADPKINIYKWYFYPLIKPDTGFKATRSVGDVKLNYPGTVDFTGDEKQVKPTVLLSTGKKHKVYRAPVRINTKMAIMENVFDNAVYPEKAIAVLLEGTFSSVFKNSVPGEIEKEVSYKDKSGFTKMMVIADDGLIINEYDSVSMVTREERYQYLKLNKDKYGVKNPDGSDKYSYSNLEFFMNVLDEMMY
ncbi:MAG: Gldg family protein, partial [Bacteroidota bacterium]